MRIDPLQLAGYKILVESLGERLKLDEDLVLASKAEEIQKQRRIRAYESSTSVSQRGCIPYRLKENEDNLTGDLENRLEVLMISSPDRLDLVFPKGGWEDDESVGEAACREALEEAGVRGRLDVLGPKMYCGRNISCKYKVLKDNRNGIFWGKKKENRNEDKVAMIPPLENALGVWQFRSKSKQNCHGMEGYCKGYMFALEVTEELEFWPEKSSHERRWLNVREAFELCRYEWMRRALEAFLRYLSDECKRRTREDAVAVAVEVAEHPIVAPSCFVNASTPSASTNPINALC